MRIEDGGWGVQRERRGETVWDDGEGAGRVRREDGEEGGRGAGGRTMRTEDEEEA